MFLFLVIVSSICFIGPGEELLQESGNIVSGIGTAVVNGAQCGFFFFFSITDRNRLEMVNDSK